LFDRVWVGTETRGAQTQRFGFTQPYQGFVNYRWLSSLAGQKIGGAWFDHGDCDAHDFVEQAWQTVLAGAREIVLFNYADLVRGHPGHELLCQDYERLADLAKTVRRNPVIGVGAYKPPHSDAGSDLYLMDFLGMLGIPLTPYSKFPKDTDVVFLPTQAATDPEIDRHVQSALRARKRLVFTTGFLSTMKPPEKWLRLTGLARVRPGKPLRAEEIRANGRTLPIKHGLGLQAMVEPGPAKVILEAVVGERGVPFLTEHIVEDCPVTVLNTHTYSQADFDAVGEVLLPPRPLGLLEIPNNWAQELRRVFGDGLGIKLRGPTRITLQPLGEAGWFVQNYNNHEVTVEVEFASRVESQFCDGFSGEVIVLANRTLVRTLAPRSRWWLKSRPRTQQE
jgi:hypothetical protein